MNIFERLTWRPAPEVMTLELNWIPKDLVSSFVRKLLDELAHSASGELQREARLKIFMVAARSGYGLLKARELNENHFRLVFAKKPITAKRALRRELEKKLASGAPFEIYYRSEQVPRAVIYKKPGRKAILCETTKGFRNFSHHHIRAMSSVDSVTTLGSNCQLVLTANAAGIKAEWVNDGIPGERWVRKVR